jgi:hypothetical protein
MSKICTGCGFEKPIDAYRLRKDAPDGHRANCIVCQDKQNDEYRSTLDGSITQLLGHAKEKAAKRKKIRTDKSGDFSLVRKDLYDIWKAQEGLCYYSGIPLSFRSSWKVSLERLDQEQGYVKSNVVFCCLELNTASQWSHEKIQEMLTILDEDIKPYDVSFDKNEGRKKLEKVQTQNIDDVLHYRCNGCKTFMTTDAFRESKYSICIECDNFRNKMLKESPRGSLQCLIKSAKTHTEKRNKSKNKHRDNSFDIDYDFLVALFKAQNGLCAYSGLPLQFGNYNETNWTTSLERIDACKGYIKTNVCLICYEFQATEISVAMKECEGNLTGWNKEKFNIFIDAVTKKFSKVIDM